MTELPSDFITSMQQQLGDQEAARLFCALTETESPVSVRLNPLKAYKSARQGEGGASQIDSALVESLGLEQAKPVAWCPGAYYLAKRPQFTLDPLFHAGCYYVQEASSMYIAEAWRHIQAAASCAPSAVLDLCAAPGGKSTLWRSLLADDCLLVANEPHRQRAEILNENLQKWGHPNVMVTNDYAAQFAAYAPNFFDVVAADVPCSGEGMFRKDLGSRSEWSLENVAKCAALQRSIIEDVWPALKPGGFLVYSTCTYNHYEDEDNVEWIIRTFGAELIMPGRHFYPHLDQGEGFFIAVLRKPAEDFRERTPRLQYIKHFDWVPYEEKGGKSSESSRGSKGAKGAKMVPQHILAMNPDTAADFPQCELTLEQALQYLRRESIAIDAPRGYTIVCYKQHPLGFVNNLGTRANNLYPQEWRIRYL